MTYDTQQGRADLLEFEARQPESFWTADPHLQGVVRHWLGPEGLTTWRPRLEKFGAECAGPVDRAARINDRIHNHPRLERWSPYGERLEAVEHHPSYHEAGRYIYGSGVMAVLGEPGMNLVSEALAYLSGQNGEAGHNCPLACTAGVIKSLLFLGTDELKERYLPRLLSTDYDTLAHGAQFLTEVQGGSDVGENAVVARPDGDAWTIHGEKWFCSNATADLILLTARPDGAPEGTKGLGLFLVPRRLEDGALNRFSLRRLKDKLGTRTMASGEIDFEGATAYALGPIEDGFKNMMTYVITTSRLGNAVGTSAIARRACHVARGYAERRRAFGSPIAEYPMVQETLADMLAETAAMTSGAFHLVALADRMETGKASEEDLGFLRLAIGLNKMRSAQSAHEVVLSGIEILGGNGAIESFSVLPRLLRDNVVYENWEGTHNVLLMQALRDCRRLSVHEAYFAALEGAVKGRPVLETALAEARPELEAILDGEDDLATLRIRPLGARLSFLQWAAAMLIDGSNADLVDHFVDRRLAGGAARDRAYADRVARIARG